MSWDKDIVLFDFSDSQRREVVFESNELVQASYDLSVMETKAVHFFFSFIGKNDKKFKFIRFKISHFNREVDINSNNFEKSREVIKWLQRKTLQITTPWREQSINWLSSYDHDKIDWYVEVELSEKLEPYLLSLQKEFTSYSIKMMNSFESKYSPRVYKLLKQYLRIWKRTLELEDLKQKLWIEKGYKQYSHFKSKILSVTQEELWIKSDIDFDFNEVTRGRKVYWIEFTIKSKSKNAENFQVKDELDVLWFSDDQKELFNMIRWRMIVLREKQILEIFKDYPYEKIKLAYSITKNNTDKQIVKAPEKYFIGLLKAEDLTDPDIEKVIKSEEARQVSQQKALFDVSKSKDFQAEWKKCFDSIITSLTDEELKDLKQRFFVEKIEWTLLEGYWEYDINNIKFRWMFVNFYNELKW